MYRTSHGSAHQIDLPDASVQCIVTSPPYWGLRKYAGDVGVEWPEVTYRLNEWTEPVTVAGCDPDCEHEWQDGPVKTLQAQQDNGPGGGVWNSESRGNDPSANRTKFSTTQGAYCRKCGGWRGDLGLEPDAVSYIGHLILCLREWRRVLRDDGTLWVNLGDSYGSSGGLKPKDLCGIPWLFAMAARADGWWLRSDVIWAKPNPMPESVSDRPTSAHEHVFLLAKSARYYYDNDAVREAAEYGYRPTTGDMFARVGNANTDPRRTTSTTSGGDGGTRNLRNVWTLATQPTPFAHFATFPESIPEKCIKAGTSARGCCPECGAPWERVVEREPSDWEQRKANGEPMRHGLAGAASVGAGGFSGISATTTGWRPTCEHDAEPVPCTVLDPFHGSGTTGIVALRLGRAYVGVDISKEYLEGVTNERMAQGAQIGFGL